MTAFKKHGGGNNGGKRDRGGGLFTIPLGLIQYATQFALECVSTVD